MKDHSELYSSSSQKIDFNSRHRINVADNNIQA